MSEIFGIFSPVLGIKENIPSILLHEAFTPECENVISRNGEVHRSKMRLAEFAYAFPDNIMGANEFRQDSISTKYLMILTKRDIAYWDYSNSRAAFLTQKYNTGTISVTQGSANISFSADITASDVKAGDFITIGTTYTSADTWYEIQSVNVAANTAVLTANYAGSSNPTATFQLRKTYAGTDPTNEWFFCTLNETWRATNGVDYIQKWTGSGVCTNSQTSYLAKIIYSYANRILLGGTIEGGTYYPTRMRFSNLGVGDTYTAADYKTFEEGTGFLKAFSEVQGMLIAFKNKNIIKMWQVSTDDVFEKKELTGDIGLTAAHSIIKRNDGIYFLASDETISFCDGFNVVSISDNYDTTIKNINPTYAAYSVGIYSEEFQKFLWALPIGSATENDTLTAWDLKEKSWTKIAVAVKCFGLWTLQTAYTIDTIPFPTIDSIGWDQIDTVFAEANAPYILIGGYDYKLYKLMYSEMDAGTAYTGYIVLQTSLSADKSTLNQFKRIIRMRPYFRNEGTGTVSFSMKRDNEHSWQIYPNPTQDTSGQTAMSMSLSGANEILIGNVPCSMRAKSFQIKTSGANKWRLLGIIFEFALEGDR